MYKQKPKTLQCTYNDLDLPEPEITGNGTENRCSYERNYRIEINNKPVLEGLANPAFRGDASKYNPEELLLVSPSSCHML